jgi:two-component sensor histidine kinase
MTGTEQIMVTGRVDRDGRLISADPRLLALQIAAGGEPSGEIAVPPLFAVIRLARTLNVPISRTIMVADGDHDVELWVRAVPEAGSIRLAIGGWVEIPADAANPAMAAGRARLSSQLQGDGRWQCDLRLVITDMSPDMNEALGIENGTGAPLNRLFRLIEDEHGELPLLGALADGSDHFRQPVESRALPGSRGCLIGAATLGAQGEVTGYAGTFLWAEPRPIHAGRPTRVDPSPPGAPAQPFVERLDKALRTPLARIIGEADAIKMAREGDLDPQYAGYAQDIAAAGRHLLGLVDDMADLHAVESPDFTVPTEPLDLSDIARRAASLLGVRAADSKVRIDAPSDDEDLMALGDFRRALQIMVNLVSNAVRYSPEGGMVWIRAEREGDLCAIVVADMGKGIAEEDQIRIFERFERVDPTEPGGSGLGLYISRRLARAMGGDIIVDSAPGKGARFVLTLPAATLDATE